VGTPLDDAEYVNLRSYRRDGSAADTPVWAAACEGKLVVFTLRESYKVKRIARNPRVQVARCDVRGGLRGPWLDAQARLVTDPVEEKRAYAALDAKYGLKMRVGTVLSTLVGRAKRRVVIEVALTEPAPAG
jgi:PPOX class probable F420-dependent enzyme